MGPTPSWRSLESVSGSPNQIGGLRVDLDRHAPRPVDLGEPSVDPGEHRIKFGRRPSERIGSGGDLDGVLAAGAIESFTNHGRVATLNGAGSNQHRPKIKQIPLLGGHGTGVGARQTKSGRIRVGRGRWRRGGWGPLGHEPDIISDPGGGDNPLHEGFGRHDLA